MAELPRADPAGSSRSSDNVLIEPKACQPKLLGSNLDAPAHDLLQSATPQTSTACAAACCANPKCAGALFEPLSAVKFGGCDVGKPCCFMKTSVADSRPNPKPVKGGADLWEIPGRSQDDEKLSFLSATLGSHMVLQTAPQQAVVWGFTAPGSTVTTIMTPAGACGAQVAAACRAQTFHSVADTKGTWRQKLPATPASTTTWYNFSFTSSSPQKESANITDVLFGDVFLCGGQVRTRVDYVQSCFSSMHLSVCPIRYANTMDDCCSQTWSFQWRRSQIARPRGHRPTTFQIFASSRSVIEQHPQRRFATCKRSGAYSTRV